MAANPIHATRSCSKCGEQKPLSDYGTQRTINGAREPRAHCRACYNAVRRANYGRPEVRTIKLAKRMAYQRDPEVVDRRKELRSRPDALAKSRAAARAYKQRPGVPQQIRAQRDQHIAQPAVKARMVFMAAQQRAKKKGLAFELSPEWVAQRVLAGRCELTGLPFAFERPREGWRKNPFTPSVDRISSRGGYTPDNCRVVLTAANIAMSEWGDGTLQAISIALLRTRGFTVLAPS